MGENFTLLVAKYSPDVKMAPPHIVAVASDILQDGVPMDSGPKESELPLWQDEPPIVDQFWPFDTKIPQTRRIPMIICFIILIKSIVTCCAYVVNNKQTIKVIRF
jgi:hypothetical protein